MPRIRFRDWSNGLNLTSPNDEVPLNSLRRARNVGPLNKSYLKAAPPFVLRENPTQAGTLHSMTRFNDVMFAGIGTVLQRDSPWATVALPAAYNPAGPETHPLITLSGSRLSFLTLQPTADFAEQLFVVDQGTTSGDNLFKIDAAGVASRWGIHPPTETEVGAVTASAAVQSKKFISDGSAADVFDNAANFTLTSDSGSGSNTIATVATPAIIANAVQIDCIKNDSVSITTAAFAAPVDLTTYGGGVDSPDEDFITFFIRIRRIKHVKSLEIAFSTDASGDFATNFFSREIGFRLVKRRRKKKLIALGDFVRSGREQEYLKNHQDRLRDLSFSEEQGNQKVFISKNTWVRVTLPKASFEESGTPSWATVRAVRVTIETNREGGARVFLDDLRLRGGVGLIGDYKYTLTYKNSATGTRSNPPIDSDTGEIFGWSVQDIERTAVSIASLPTTGLDPQVTHLEIWRTVGNGEAYFKVDEVTAGTAVFTDNVADYPGLHSGDNVTYLDPTLELPIDNDSPNDADFNFRCAAGPHYGRVFWGNNQDNTGGAGNVYYSPSGRAEAVQSFIQVTGGDTDRVQNLVIWNDKLYAFTIGGLYEITGTDEPFIPQKIEGAPGLRGINAVAGTTVGLFYRGPDGIYLFNGASVRNITDQSLLPIFKEAGATEDFSANYQPAAFAGSKNQLWVGASGDFTLVLDFDTQAWRYREPVTALYYDALNSEVLGGSGGDIYALEPAPFDTSGTAYTFDVKLPAVRVGNGQYGVCRKLWVDIDTQSEAAVAVSIIVDGSSTSLGNLSAVSGRRTVEFNLARAFAERFEVQITGTSINQPMQLFGVEEDIYVPDESFQDSGLGATRL